MKFLEICEKEYTSKPFIGPKICFLFFRHFSYYKNFMLGENIKNKKNENENEINQAKPAAKCIETLLSGSIQ